MKAILCKELGPPSKLVLEDIQDPVIKEDEVLVQVKACSINFPDTLIIQGLYQFKPKLPFSPGSDISGVIEKVGEKIKHLKVGDEVIGISTHGGFAQKIALKANLVIPKPRGMSFEKAAAFLFTYGTSMYALKMRASMQSGETLLVLGASGGVGLTAIEIGKIMGARVIAAASNYKKLDLCKEYGADEVINYEVEDLKQRVKEITNGKGADVIVDPVGGKYANPAVRACAWEGRYLVIGFAGGEIPSIPLNLPLLKNCQIVGVFMGAFLQKFPAEALQMMKELLIMHAQGKLNPHIQKTLPLDRAPEGIQNLMDRKAVGKIVVSMT